jgi:hypothetical protein
MNKRCATCRWATFDMTNHNPPRPRPKRVGRCEFDIEGRTNEFFSGLPECVTSSYSFQAVRNALGAQTIWPDDGTVCPCWELKGTS